MPFPELKRAAGPQTDASGSGAKTEQTSGQIDFSQRLKDYATDDGLDLQHKPIAECAFATPQVTGNNFGREVIQHTVILAEPAVKANPQGNVNLFERSPDDYVISLTGVLPDCKEKIGLMDAFSPEKSVLLTDVAVTDIENNVLRMARTQVCIGKATDQTDQDAVLVVTAKRKGAGMAIQPHVIRFWGKIEELFDAQTGQLKLSSTPEAAAVPLPEVASQEALVDLVAGRLEELGVPREAVTKWVLFQPSTEFEGTKKVQPFPVVVHAIAGLRDSPVAFIETGSEATRLGLVHLVSEWGHEPPTLPPVQEDEKGCYIDGAALIDKQWVSMPARKVYLDGGMIISVYRRLTGLRAYVTSVDAQPASWQKFFKDGNLIIPIETPLAEPAAAPKSLDLHQVYQTVVGAAREKLGIESIRPEDLLLLLEPKLKFMPVSQFPPNLRRSLTGKLLLVAPVSQRVSPKGAEIYHFPTAEPYCKLYLDLLGYTDVPFNILDKELPQEGEITILARSQTGNKIVTAKVKFTDGGQMLFDENGNVRPDKLTAAVKAATAATQEPATIYQAPVAKAAPVTVAKPSIEATRPAPTLAQGKPGRIVSEGPDPHRAFARENDDWVGKGIISRRGLNDQQRLEAMKSEFAQQDLSPSRPSRAAKTETPKRHRSYKEKMGLGDPRRRR